VGTVISRWEGFTLIPPDPALISESSYRKFLEEYPLYRKYAVTLPDLLQRVPKPGINMHCKVCESNQTFAILHEYYDGIYGRDGYSEPFNKVGTVTIHVEYQCAACKKFMSVFLLKFSEEEKYIMKVGQEPPWEISIDRNIGNILGKNTIYYQRGLIFESQSYGIGAFAYYRRILEETIDELLEEISGFIGGEGREEYSTALEKVKETHIAEEKIRFVKDLLPTVLRPGGMNPLSILHSAFSRGLHSESDEQCVEIAATVREALLFLVSRVFDHKSASKKFTESMQRLLDRKS
jgi:hypothetical protein